MADGVVGRCPPHPSHDIEVADVFCGNFSQTPLTGCSKNRAQNEKSTLKTKGVEGGFYGEFSETALAGSNENRFENGKSMLEPQDAREVVEVFSGKFSQTSSIPSNKHIVEKGKSMLDPQDAREIGQGFCGKFSQTTGSNKSLVVNEPEDAKDRFGMVSKRALKRTRRDVRCKEESSELAGKASEDAGKFGESSKEKQRYTKNASGDACEDACEEAPVVEWLLALSADEACRKEFAMGYHKSRKRRLKQAVSKPNDRRRGTYSNDEKNVVIDSQRLIGSRQKRPNVSRTLGILDRTSDVLWTHFNKNDSASFRDERRHRTQQTHVHRGKITPEIGMAMQNWIYENPGLTMEDMRRYVNNMTLYGILQRRGIDPGYVELASEHIPEQLAKHLEQVEIDNEFKESGVSVAQTVTNWMQKMGFSRKAMIHERKLVNTDANRKTRLKFASKIWQMFLNDNTFLLFQDEVPFYLCRHRLYGYAHKGVRPAELKIPGSALSLQCQVGMVVNPSFGVIKGRVYPQENESTEIKASNHSKLKQNLNWKDFHDFMEQTLETLMTMEGKVKGKEIVLVIGNMGGNGDPKDAADPGIALGGCSNEDPEESVDINDLLGGCSILDKFQEFLTKTSTTFRVLRSPPKSVQINLCEYYNRKLRELVNTEHYSFEAKASMLDDIEHIKEMNKRVDTLDQVVSKCMENLDGNLVEHSVQTWKKFIHDVIEKDGFLDYRKKMF
uniref:Uncharacterized protein n=1 Tax=Mucochytrium quahogii TaxID=96639 RepID=A0A7S2WR98_9STRA